MVKCYLVLQAQGAVDDEFFYAYCSIRQNPDQGKRNNIQRTLAAYEADCREVLRVVLCSQICAHTDSAFEGVDVATNDSLGLQLAAERKILSQLEVEGKEWHSVLSADVCVWLPGLIALPRTSLPCATLCEKMDQELLDVKTVAEEARKVAIALVNATVTQRTLYSTPNAPMATGSIKNARGREAGSGRAEEGATSDGV